jgi:hypothetical protein
MERREADEIIAAEGLGRYVRLGPPDGGAADKVCLFARGAEWVTLMTDERAVVQEATVRTFATESDALEDLIDGARVLKSAREFRSR